MKLGALVLLGWLVLVGAEDVIECDSENGTYTVQPGNPVRVTSRGYPNPERFTHRQCQITFSAPGSKLQITFVNGLLVDENQLITLYGLDDAPGGRNISLNTAYFLSTTYTAGPNLTIFVPFFYFHFWFGFEAIVSITTDGTPKCGSGRDVSLVGVNGPIEFGTDFNNDGQGVIDCSWRVHASQGQPIKMVVKYALLLPGETLQIVGTDGSYTISSNTSKPVAYRFPHGGSLDVKYHRTAASSSAHGVSLQASVYQQTGQAGCNISVDSTRTLGKAHSSVILDNNVVFTNDSADYVTPYLPNQNCLWAFTADLGYELHIVAMKTYTETGADLLTLISPALTKAETIDSFSDQHFVFDRNTSPLVNITWVSDGNIGLQGYNIWLHTRECVCLMDQVKLTLDQPSVYIYSFADIEYCNNIQCQHKIYAPAGYSFVLSLDATLRNVTGDELRVTDGQNELFHARNSDAVLTYSKDLYSSTGYMEINLSAGAVWRYAANSAAGQWSGTLRLVNVDRTMTTLDADHPAVYKSSKGVGNWTVAGVNRLVLLALSGPMDGVNWFNITDGDGTYLGDFSDCQNPSQPLMSKTNTVNIQRTRFDSETDFAIYVRDTSEIHQCEQEIVQLLPATYSVYVKGGGTDFCYSTLDDTTGTTGSDHFITLTDISYSSLPVTNPIRILAGVIRNSDYDSALIAQLDSSTQNLIWSSIEVHNRLGTIRLPAGAWFNATAYRHNHNVDQRRVVWCGQSGTVSSEEYGQENRQYTREMHDEVVLYNGRTLITLELTAFLNENDRLVISSNSLEYRTTYANLTVIRKNITFTSDGFKFDYYPSATGEKGFLIKYTFAGCNNPTTVAPPEPYDYEQSVRCTGMGNDTVYTFNSGDATEITPYRVKTRDYPYAAVGTHPACRVEFSAPGLTLKVQFVNAYLDKGQEVTLTGVDGGGIVNTTMNTGLPGHFLEFTYIAHDDLVIQLPQFDANSWFGFEAVVTVVNDNKNCYNNYVVDLEHFEGPVEFGTNWSNNSTFINRQPDVCSWHLKKHSGTEYHIKLRVLKAQLRSGESLYFVDDVRRIIPYVKGNDTYVFKDQSNIYVYYARNGSDSSDFGVYFQASNAYTKYTPSPEKCWRPTNGTLTMGTNVTSLTVSNVVDYFNGTLLRYLDNQQCQWSYNVERGYELRVYLSQLITEECCDKLTMDSSSSQTLSNVAFGSGVNRMYIFDRNTDTTVNFTWLSDPSISLAGFIVDLDVTNCSCAYPSVSLSHSNPRQLVSSYSTGYSYCNNIYCVNLISAPTQFTIVLNVAGRLRDVPGEYLLVESTKESNPGTSPLFLRNSTGEFTATIVSALTSTMKVTLNSGKINVLSDVTDAGRWDAVADLIKEFSSSTNLTAAVPSQYKSSAEIGVWTVKSGTKVQLVAFSDDFDALKGYTLHDGDVTATGFTLDKLFYKNTTAFVSSGNTLTVTRDDWLMQTDFAIVVKDAGSTFADCDQPFLFKTNVFKVQATTACALTMISPAEYFSIDHFITLGNLSLTLADENNPISVILGTYSPPDYTNTLTVISSTTLAEHWLNRSIDYHERIITIVMPANSVLGGFASANDVVSSNKTLSLNEKSSFSSRNYGRPNYRFDAVERYSAICRDGNSLILFSMRMDLRMGGQLTLSSIPAGVEIKYPGADSLDASTVVYANFTAAGFVAEYKPSATGELGFILYFTFGNSVPPPVTTTTTTTTTTTPPRGRSAAWRNSPTFDSCLAQLFVVVLAYALLR